MDLSLDKTDQLKSWVHLRKLPYRKNASTMLSHQLTEFCLQYVDAVRVVLMHNRGQALIEMTYHDQMQLEIFFDAIRVTSPEKEEFMLLLSGWTCPAVAQLGQPNKTSGWDMTDDTIISTEVARCINKLIKDVVTKDSIERRDFRRRNRLDFKHAMAHINRSRFHTHGDTVDSSQTLQGM